MSSLMSDIDLLTASIKRVFCGKHYIFTQQKEIKYLDLSVDAQLRLLIDWAETTKSHAILNLASSVIDHLIEEDGTLSLGLDEAVDCIEALDKAPWVQQNAAPDFRRRMLDAALKDLSFASAYGWVRLLRYEQLCAAWLVADTTIVDAALKEYKTKRVYEEIGDNESAGQLEDLNTYLTQLQDDFGISLSDAISQVEEEIAEKSRHEDSAEGGGFMRPTKQVPLDPPNENEVRRMFRTLIS